MKSEIEKVEIFEVPRNIISDLSGYEFISSINIRTYNLNDSIIIFDFYSNQWFDANLCSPLGGLIEDLRLRGNIIYFHGIQENIESLFKLNGFYINIDQNFHDERSIFSKIDYRKFSLHDSNLFQDYIDKKLLAHDDFPTISVLLSKKINKSLLEIFNNAHTHGECHHVFTCGQYFPKEARLKFTMSDLGITIRKNVNIFFNSGSKITGIEALEWAVQEGNTTKDGRIPGGLGFGLIRDFLKKNEGCIQIVSSNGYWEERNGIPFGKELVNRFLGTIVNLEFNLNDKKSYILASEISPENIF